MLGVTDQVSTSFQENINKSKSSEHYPDTSEQPVEKMYSLILPYAGILPYDFAIR